MTYREVGDIIQAHNENEKNEIRKNCMISYNTAALFRIAVASVLDDNIKFPSIHQAFPDLFGEEKQENQQDGQQDWRIQKDRIEQYARLLKAKRGEKINDN